MEKSQLQQVLEDILDEAVYDFEIRSYSGRGMYGKECLAIVTDESLWDIALEVGMKIIEDEIGEQIPTPREDNCANSMIYYWPGITYIKDETDGIETED